MDTESGGYDMTANIALHQQSALAPKVPPSVKPRTEPFEPVSDEIVLRLAREAQSRIDGSVGAPSMIVGCYTLAALCAEIALHRAVKVKP